MIGSPAFPLDRGGARARAEETFDRGVSASGVMRQMLAILNQPDRARALAALRMPAAVVHGSADKMVHVSGGRATARAIPGAELLVIDGMGHDMPEAVRDVHRDDPAYGGPGEPRVPGRPLGLTHAQPWSGAGRHTNWLRWQPFRMTSRGTSYRTGCAGDHLV